MDIEQFRTSLKNRQADAGLSVHLQSLWFDGTGNWGKSHELIQDLADTYSARIHAYLHRKEGDQANALYWYRRAGVTAFKGTLQQEWDELVKELLKD